MVSCLYASTTNTLSVPGGATMLAAASSPERVEAPVTVKAYLLCVFASFGGIFFGLESPRHEHESTSADHVTDTTLDT